MLPGRSKPSAGSTAERGSTSRSYEEALRNGLSSLMVGITAWCYLSIDVVAVLCVIVWTSIYCAVWPTYTPNSASNNANSSAVARKPAKHLLFKYISISLIKLRSDHNTSLSILLSQQSLQNVLSLLPPRPLHHPSRPTSLHNRFFNPSMLLQRPPRLVA